jgi:predicted metalloenzyme YecM
MDHICYRTSSLEEYRQVIEECKTFSTLLIESTVGGRLISTFELDIPLRLVLRDGHQISLSVLEVPSPKSSSNYQSGLEHVEFVVSDPLEEFMLKYPMKWDLSALHKEVNADIRLTLEGCSVKFHNTSLKNVIQQSKSAPSFTVTKFSK